MAEVPEVRELASGLQFPEGPVARPDGSVLVVEIGRGSLSRVTTDGAIEVVADLGGGPNGAAMGPDGACYVVNNGGFLWSVVGDMRIPLDLATGSNEPENFAGGWVERVDLAAGESKVLYRDCDGQTFRSPNDIVFDDAGGFWFTDLGKTRPRDLDKGGLYYAAPDGSSVRCAAFGTMGANGVGLSPGGDRVYVAESFTGRLWGWDLEAPGRVKPIIWLSRPLIWASRPCERMHAFGAPLVPDVRRNRRRRGDRPGTVRRATGPELRVRGDARPVHHECLLHRSGSPDRACHPLGRRSARGARLGSPGVGAPLLVTSIAELVRARAADGDRTALRFEDERWTWSEYVRAGAQRAAYLDAELDRDRPPHVGLLLDNVPEFPLWLGAVALAGAAVVGINPTRRGPELERDIRHADCQLIVTEARYLELLDGLDLGPAAGRLLVVEDSDDALAPYRDAPLTDRPVDARGIYLLLFTSGTSGAPKACILSQGRLAQMSGRLSQMMGFTPDDVMYEVMPLFHSNAIITGFAPWLVSGATLVLRRKFSASGFLPDVRRYGVTYFNYVGKPLSYILATPERPDDGDNTLTRVFGNEAADLDIDRFSRRFAVPVTDGYGSTEGGANINRTPDTPKGALGVGPEGTVILDSVTGEECPSARFDDGGHLLNPDEAIGEIVNKNGAAGFEGYYHNDEANAARVRSGYYWTGDLGYRDASGFFYFAGRDFEWLRVDGENFAAAPVERILARHPDVVLAVVYAVPDEDVGDQVMAALELRPGATFDPEAFDRFLAEQPDLGTKWSPRYVRISAALPVTETQKVVKRALRRERWEVADPLYWRPHKGEALRPMTDDDRRELHARFAARDRLDQLERV